jgi:hypothetical protein
MSVTFLKYPHALIFAPLKRFIDLVNISSRRNIDGIEQPSTYAQLNMRAFVRTTQFFQYTPIGRDPGFSGLYQNHVCGMPSALNNLNKVIHEIAGELHPNDVKMVYAFRKKRRISDPKNPLLCLSNWLGPKSLARVPVPIGPI